MIERYLPLSRHLTGTSSSAWPVISAQSVRISETKGPSLLPMTLISRSHGSEAQGVTRVSGQQLDRGTQARRSSVRERCREKGLGRIGVHSCTFRKAPVPSMLGRSIRTSRFTRVHRLLLLLLLLLLLCCHKAKEALLLLPTLDTSPCGGPLATAAARNGT